MGGGSDEAFPIKGEACTVDYARRADGSAPAEEFLNEEAPPKDRASILRACELLARDGRICNPQKFKKVDGEIWEFKGYQVRIAAFLHKGTWYLTHGFIKKKDRWKQSDLDRANRIRAEHLARSQRG